MMIRSPAAVWANCTLVIACSVVAAGCVYLDLPASDQTRAQYTRVQIAAYSSALERYKNDVGEYPTSSEGLEALVIAPTGATRWRGPYLEPPQIRKDGWSRAFIYRAPVLPGERPDIISYGRDGRPGGRGTDEDIHRTTTEADKYR